MTTCTGNAMKSMLLAVLSSLPDCLAKGLTSKFIEYKTSSGLGVSWAAKSGLIAT